MTPEGAYPYPWTHEELEEMKAELSAALDKTERERPEVRPLPPMTEGEALALLNALVGTAETRPLTGDEAFLHGQLLSCFRMAVRADTLGHKGRFFVISQDDVERLARK